MFDFLSYEIIYKNKEAFMVPSFKLCNTKDLMIKGNRFFAIWNETLNLWTTNVVNAYNLIDEQLMKEWVDKKKEPGYENLKYVSITDYNKGYADKFNNYCKIVQDNFVPINQKVIFSNSTVSKEDYATFKLDYPLASGNTTGWDKLLDILYSSERQKIEWILGAIISGESDRLQKFLTFYGPPGSGKSTVLDIISDMFKGYVATFSAKALGSSSDSHALEPFSKFPIIAIEHDADLSKIESNARLNSLVSHESLIVDEKFKGLYEATFNTILMIGTNEPVRITNAKSGLLRRLIDVNPTGNTVNYAEYKTLRDHIKFEYSGIAYKCLKFYEDNKSLYDKYIPTEMIGATNNVFMFFEDNYDRYSASKYVTLNEMWLAYKQYLEESNISWGCDRLKFKNEAKEYFAIFHETKKINGKSERNVYEGFIAKKFFRNVNDVSISEQADKKSHWLDLKSGLASKFDILMHDCLAQGCRVSDDRSGREIPKYKWENVKTHLSDISTSEVHFVKVPVEHIVIDFDIKGDNGEKSLERNIEAASKFPPTYAEVSKSGSGLHLHYIYTGGDPEKLSRIYDDNIEVKVYTGNSSLRRKLTMCNDLDIASISSGLPLKEDNKKMVNENVMLNERAIRTIVRRNLAKEYHSDTSSSINYIFSTLENAYENGTKYDVTDMRPAVLAFAAQSSNQSERCLKMVAKMHFKSDDMDEDVGSVGSSGNVGSGSVGSDSGSSVEHDPSNFIFYDVEVFPNLFVVVWKKAGPENKCVTWINPSPGQIRELCRNDLIGFNNRDYDNHILYARMMGYTELELYRLSKRIIGNESKNAKFGEAYNLSYTDIYDFASAGHKQGLKKWEIELDIHHLELGLPWDDPVPEDMWEKVAEYCINDVVSTEAVFNHLKSDYTARIILADVAGGTANDTTNQLTNKLIFGNVREPQGEFRYRNLAEPVDYVDEETMKFLKKYCPNMVTERFGSRKSILPYFEGYTFEFGKSLYKGREVGEGGYVYAEPNIYYNVALIDITSMHPHSVISECLFGPRFTQIFYELVYARVYIKHKEWDKLKTILDGKLSKYIDKILSGEFTAKDLSNALKTAINSVYGLTAAKFPNKFRDHRNIDNIVAKRGALFMVDLEEAVKAQGFHVAHIKTDSIKIPNATPEIIKFVMEFSEKYGYHFEHEATYEKMCLVNNAVYIAKYATSELCEKLYGYIPGDNADHGGQWTATGAQFAEPYIFKNLFSHEEITFKDMCQTKSVKTFMVLDFNEALGEDEHEYKFVGKVGEFVPVVQGINGGLLKKEAVKKVKTDDGDVVEVKKYDSVTGTQGYRWLESEVAKHEGGTTIVDKGYFRDLTNKAVSAISVYGDFEEFVG